MSQHRQRRPLNTLCESINQILNTKPPGTSQVFENRSSARKKQNSKENLLPDGFSKKSSKELQALRSKYLSEAEKQNRIQFSTKNQNRQDQDQTFKQGSQIFDEKSLRNQEKLNLSIASNLNQVSKVSSSSSRISQLRDDFARKVDKVNQGIEEKMIKLETQISRLKYERNPDPQSNPSRSPEKSKSHEFESNAFEAIRIQESFSPQKQDTTEKRAYLNRMRSVNYLEEMERKIQEIENQKNKNISKSLSSIKESRTEYLEGSTDKKPVEESARQRLALLTPNLAESEIIEFTESGQQIIGSYAKKAADQNPSVTKFGSESISQKVIFRRQFNGKSPISEKPLEESQADHIRESKVSQSSRIDANNRSKIDNLELKGEFNITQEEIPKDFAVLINRIAYQAELDNRFNQQVLQKAGMRTTKGQSLRQIIDQKVKALMANEGSTDMSLYEINQMEIDPLFTPQNITKDYQLEELNFMSLKVKNKFIEMNKFFNKKLHNRFSAATVEFFVKELMNCHGLSHQEGLNAGHLTSYINMRTGKNFRNRSFYKLLTRINGCVFAAQISKEKLIGCFCNLTT